MNSPNRGTVVSSVLNGDSKVDDRDIQRFVEVVLKPESASVIELLKADANGDRSWMRRRSRMC